jgi:hypothetical protein
MYAYTAEYALIIRSITGEFLIFRKFLFLAVNSSSFIINFIILSEVLIHPRLFNLYNTSFNNRQSAVKVNDDTEFRCLSVLPCKSRNSSRRPELKWVNQKRG